MTSSFAVIFDLDGVVSDTEKLHAQSGSHMFARYGVQMAPEDISAKFAGAKAEVVIATVLGDRVPQEQIGALVEEKWRDAIALAREHVDPVDGAPELIRTLAAAGVPLAIASGSIRAYVDVVLAQLDLAKYFQVVMTGDDVKNGKPDPEIFLTAAKKLGVDPQTCVVIEDGMNGMLAAKAAGMACVALVGDMARDVPADRKVTSLRQLSVENLCALTQSGTRGV